MTATVVPGDRAVPQGEGGGLISTIASSAADRDETRCEVIANGACEFCLGREFVDVNIDLHQFRSNRLSQRGGTVKKRMRLFGAIVAAGALALTGCSGSASSGQSS